MGRPVVKQSLTTEVCSNCREATFTEDGEASHRINIGVFIDADGAVDASPANEHCTRPTRVVSKGCVGCLGLHYISERGSCPSWCKLTPEDRYLDDYYVKKEGRRPPWCRLTDDENQPNEGVLVVAEAPAKEDG